MDIIYQGIGIDRGPSKYFQVKPGPTIRSSRLGGIYTIEFPEGSTSESVAGTLGLQHFGEPLFLDGMENPSRFVTPEFSLNGLRFRRLTYDPHLLKIVLVSDSESRIVQSYTGTTVVVSKDDYRNPEFAEYVLYSGGLQYIVPVTPKSCIPKGWEFRNFPWVPIVEGTDLESESETIYSLRNRYDDYRIRSIDYQEQFIKEVRAILGDYGVELVRTNREQTLSVTSYVSYGFNQTPTKDLHPKLGDLDSGVLHHRVPVDFEFRCTNMQMFYDFKNRYNNVDFLSGLTEFVTPDRYGEPWTAAVRWGQITEDFSHNYVPDGNSNFSYQASFRAELFFTEVYDRIGELIKEVSLELETKK